MNESTSQQVRTVRNVRLAYRLRNSRTSDGDIAYMLYALLLVTITAIFPVVRAVVLQLSTTEVREALQGLVETDAGLRIGSGLLGLIVMIFAGVGTMRGPVAPTPFFVKLLMEPQTPRRVSLSHYFWVAFAWLMLGGAAGGVLLGVAFGEATAIGIGAVAGSLFAGLVAWVWLMSQLLAARAWVMVLAIGLWSLAVEVVRSMGIEAVYWATPWGIAAHAGLGNVAAIAALAAIGLVLLFVPILLDRLNMSLLLQQAYSWETVGAAAGLGDFATALGRLRARATAFRKVRAVRQLPLPLLFLWRDVLGAIRTPMRCAVSACALTVISALWSGALAIEPEFEPWKLGMIMCAASYLALSGFTDGFRHAAEVAGSPALYGWSTGKLYALHALFPGIFGAVLMLLGVAGASALLGSNQTWDPISVFGAITVLSVSIAARAFDSLKGPIPLALATTPISTPVGDPGIFFQMMWRADALLIAVVGTSTAIYAASVALIYGACVLAGVVLILVWSTHRRVVRAG